VNNEEKLRYPIGKFEAQESYSTEELKACINRIESLPPRVEAIVQKLTSKQLDTTYRDGGWTARQVIHHISDSHMNAYIRFKWTLTEETPLIKAYNEKAWAETPETKSDPGISINLLKSLHAKWIILLKQIPPQDLQKQFIHPETGKHLRLDRLMALYAWHGDHHLGHLEIVSKK
jgi:hypothetical protein